MPRIFELLREIADEYQQEVNTLREKLGQQAIDIPRQLLHEPQSWCMAVSSGVMDEARRAELPPAPPVHTIEEDQKSNTTINLDETEANGIDESPSGGEVKRRGFRRQNGSDIKMYDILDLWTSFDADEDVVGSVHTEGKMTTAAEDVRRSQEVLQGLPGLSADNESELDRRKHGYSKYRIHPDSIANKLRESFGIMLILYDAIALPLMLFVDEHPPGVVFMMWVTRIWWSLDIFFTLATALPVSATVVETSLVAIFVHYAKTWLVPDVVIVVIDWATSDEIIGTSGNGSSGTNTVGMARTLRYVRMVRMVRLMRLAKVPRIANIVGEHLQSEESLLVFTIMKILCFLVWVAHTLAGIWYLIGSNSEEGARWVDDLERPSLAWKYTVALHFTLIQFTGGEGDMRPTIIEEQCYLLLVMVMAWVMAASFVSIMTTSLTRLQMITAASVTKMAVLRKFMHDNHISMALAARVMKTAQRATAMRMRNTPEGEVEMMIVVSEPLKSELHVEMFGPILSQHPLFRTVQDVNPFIFAKVCHGGVKKTILHQGDRVFCAGEIPDKPRMIFVVEGAMVYSNTKCNEVAHVGDWLCEGVLWTNWTHKGNLVAVDEDVVILEIDAAMFMHTCQSLKARLKTLKPTIYAKEFVKMLNDPDTLRNGDLNTCRESLDQAVLMSLKTSMSRVSTVSYLRATSMSRGMTRSLSAQPSITSFTASAQVGNFAEPDEKDGSARNAWS